MNSGNYANRPPMEGTTRIQVTASETLPRAQITHSSVPSAHSTTHSTVHSSIPSTVQSTTPPAPDGNIWDDIHDDVKDVLKDVKSISSSVGTNLKSDSLSAISEVEAGLKVVREDAVNAINAAKTDLESAVNDVKDLVEDLDPTNLKRDFERGALVFLGILGFLIVLMLIFIIRSNGMSKSCKK